MDKLYVPDQDHIFRKCSRMSAGDVRRLPGLKKYNLRWKSADPFCGRACWNAPASFIIHRISLCHPSIHLPTNPSAQIHRTSFRDPSIHLSVCLPVSVCLPLHTKVAFAFCFGSDYACLITNLGYFLIRPCDSVILFFCLFCFCILELSCC